MSIDEKVSQLNEKIPQVYEAGHNSGEEEMLRAMWEEIQEGGTRTDYSNLITKRYWSPKTFKPIYDITQSDNWYDFGRDWGKGYIDYIKEHGRISIKDLEEEQGISFIIGRGGNQHVRLCISPLFSEYNIVDISQSISLLYAFYGGYDSGGLYPERIEHLICSETTPFVTSTFQYARSYEHIGFEGEIGQNGLDLQWSTKLDRESLLALINCLVNKKSDTSGTQWVVTLGAENLAKLTDTEKASATEKGWTLA